MSVEHPQRARAQALRDTPESATALVAWAAAAGPDAPWLATADRYAVLVGEVMAQQTQLARAISRWQQWMERWPDPGSLAAASLADVLALWQGLGYPRRARALHEAAQIISQEGWPERLTDLPGVGAYTAAALAVFADHAPVLARDVNVERVLARRYPHGLAIDDYPATTSALMRFGQQICRATPRCAQCPLRDGCPVGLGHAPDPVTPARRQAPYQGSLRQRRGRLLGQVLAGADVALDADPEAAQGLIADGLLRAQGQRLRAP